MRRNFLRAKILTDKFSPQHVGGVGAVYTMSLKGSVQPVMWMLQKMNFSTHCAKMVEIEGILDNVLSYILPLWKNAFDLQWSVKR